MNRGLFLTFEGIEGCGKTTQLRRLAAWLESRGHAVETSREPGGTALGLALRRQLLDPDLPAVSPVAEVFLYVADRAQHVQERIRPALNRGHIFLCDRYADATVVYQGIARGFGKERAMDLNAIATGGLIPDRTILLDLPVEEGLRRVSERRSKETGGANRMDDEPGAFHEAIRRGYLEVAAGNPDRVAVIDALGTEDDVHRKIVDVLSTWLLDRGY